MAGEKKTMIVIKKITVAGGGAHGGSWKVAFADFMTAMMAFFLVMWLLNQTPETKKAVARYFSGPSVIEQQLSTYGAELTLEKLFLDLVNEPFKPFQTMLAPSDATPDLFSLGTKKIVFAHILHEMGKYAKNVEVADEEIRFDIPDNYLFEQGSEQASGQFASVMENVKELLTGLDQTNVHITSFIHTQQVGGDEVISERVANRRGEVLKSQVESSLEHDTVDVFSRPAVMHQKVAPGKPTGLIRFQLKQREVLPENFKPRVLRGNLGQRPPSDTNIYDSFVRRMTDSNKKTPKE